MVSSGQAQMLFAGLIDQRAERNCCPSPVPLQYDPGVLALIFKAAGAGDHVEQTFARRLCWDPARGRVCAILISPTTVMSEVFWVTSATTACGSIARFLIRSTISCSTSAASCPRRVSGRHRAQ